jgi:hypothetical protein
MISLILDSLLQEIAPEVVEEEKEGRKGKHARLDLGNEGRERGDDDLEDYDDS